MDLNTYFQYALVTGIVALMVIVIALLIQSVLAEQTFTSNLLLTRQFEQMDKDRNKSGNDLDFDIHVESTPGMRYYPN